MFQQLREMLGHRARCSKAAAAPLDEIANAVVGGQMPADLTLKQYLRHIEAATTLSAASERQLCAHACAGGMAAAYACKELVKANLGLVVFIARLHAGDDEEELWRLVGVGNHALVRAASCLEPCEHLPFSTYAACCIRKEIERALPAFGPLW